MKPSVSILYLLAVSANVADVIADGSVFDSWTHNDLKNYVSDRQKSLGKLSSKSFEDLKESLSRAWPAESSAKNSWWNFWPSQESSGSISLEPVTEWLFETWPIEGVREFLKKHGFRPHPKSTKDQLIRHVKDNFAKISEKLDTSGFYPSASYFEGWSPEDFKSWLLQYEIPFEDESDELLDKVRENIYHISKAAEEKRLNTLNSLDLANRDLLDSAGEIKDDVFQNWSVEDLRNWLNSHKIPYGDNIEDKRDKLAELASDQKELLKDDIQWYLEAAQRRASPFLHKTPEYVSSIWEKTLLNLGNAFDTVQNKVGDVINDTFLIDLDNWSRDRITDFLDARGISYSPFSTNEQLRGLVKEFRNRPLKKAQEKYEQVTDGEWYHDLGDWAREKSDAIQSSDCYKSFSNNAKNLGENTQSWASGIGQKIKNSFDSWRKSGFGVSSNPVSKDQFLNAAKEIKKMARGKYRQSWSQRWSDTAKNYFSRLSNLVLGH